MSTTARTERYDLVVALNYYAPYVSGVTEVARAVLVPIGVGCSVIGSAPTDVAVAPGRPDNAAVARLLALTAGVATTWLPGLCS